MKLGGLFISDMDTLVTIEQPTVSVDSVSSQRKSTWATFATAWASRSIVSRETFEVDKQTANFECKWTIRYLNGVTEKMRVAVSGEYHYIKGIETMDRRTSMVLITERRDG